MSLDTKENLNELSVENKINNKAKHDCKKKKYTKKKAVVVINKEQHHNETKHKHINLSGAQVKKAFDQRIHNQVNSSRFAIAITNQDLDICRKTAMQLHEIRESIVVDQALINHLNIVAFTREQFQFEQQHKASIFQAEHKRLEVTKWLSTKSEKERQEYYQRMGQP